MVRGAVTRAGIEAGVRAFMDALEGPVACLTPEGDLLAVNRALAARAGLTPEAAESFSLAAVLSRAFPGAPLPSDMQDRLRRVLGGGTLRIPGGTDGAAVVFTFSPLRDTGGAVAGVVFEAREETDHLKTDILESISDGFLSLDRDLRVRYVNNVAARSIGKTREELTGRILTDAAPALRGTAFERNYRLTVADRKPRRFEVSYMETGGLAWYLISVFPARDGITAFGQIITGRKKAELALRESYGKLERSIDGVIAAITKIVETRDPYTAGHQRRVSEIARAIGAELGLSGERLNALRMAGVIHDIGKIYVPAEILSKPGRLSDVEYRIVQVHPQASYDILKNIDFPWPVAEIAYQHQERLDGSGYPRGLKGDEIMLETRILSVADTFEAMVFHRPYRYALGIEKAVAELERGRGAGYDPGVVDACVRLVREGRLPLKDAG